MAEQWGNLLEGEVDKGFIINMAKKEFSTNPNIEKVDFENGEVLQVSLISSGEILGHGMYLNESGIDSFFEAIEGKQIKAYYKHSDENEALSSIGFFSEF